METADLAWTMVDINESATGRFLHHCSRPDASQDTQRLRADDNNYGC